MPDGYDGYDGLLVTPAVPGGAPFDGRVVLPGGADTPEPGFGLVLAMVVALLLRRFRVRAR